MMPPGSIDFESLRQQAKITEMVKKDKPNIKKPVKVDKATIKSLTGIAADGKMLAAIKASLKELGLA